MDTENTTAHVFIYAEPYDGRCMYCDCRAYGIHASEPCNAPK